MIKKLLVILALFNYSESQEFTFRTINGNQNEGYVEATINATIGIMSRSFSQFDDSTAKLLCRHFGFGLTGFSTISPNEQTLPSNSSLWNNLMQCSGTETDIRQCVNGTWTNNGQMVSTLYSGWTRLHCFAYEVTDIRLAGGLYPHVGRFEVKVGNRWGLVCNPGPTNPTSYYGGWMCPLFGYSEAISKWNTMPLEITDSLQPVTDWWMTSLNCDKGATLINSCSYTKGTVHPCSDGIYFRCDPVQLRNGVSQNSGIIQASLFRKQYQFCDTSSFNAGAANVTCHLLGHHSAGAVTAVPHIATDTSILFSGSIQCDGSEQSLEQCEIIQEHGSCQTENVLHIECLDNDIDMLPVTNNTLNEGIFTFKYYNKLWLLKGKPLSNTTAMTLCNLLGHGFSGMSNYVDELPVNANLPEYSVLLDLECNGNETNVAQCTRTPYYWFPCRMCQYVPPPDGFAVLYCEECPLGYYGKFCTECNCNNRDTGPCDIETGHCSCKDEWTGDRCEIDTDECLMPAVCPENLTCINIPGSYQCDCTTGYTLIDGVCIVEIQESADSESNLLIVLLASVIGGLVLISCTAIMCMWRYRKRGSKSQSETGTHGSSPWTNQDNNTPSTDPSEEYSTIDDRVLGDTRAIGYRDDPYNTIDTSVRTTSNRTTDRTEHNVPVIRINRHIGDYDYPYPTTIPRDDAGYIKLDGLASREVPTDKDGYLMSGNVQGIPTETDGYIIAGNPAPVELVKDVDGYLRMGDNDKLSMADLGNNYQKLNPQNNREHEYFRMKH